MKFPILIKPSDAFSGRGIVRVETAAETSAAIDLARSQSKRGSIVLEEFVDGDLYSHSAFLRDRRVVFDFFVNEYCTVYPYQVNSSHLSFDLDEKIIEGLRTCIQQLAELLHLTDGLIHTQFIVDNRSFYIIELMRRCPGDLYSMLIQKSTNIDYADLYVSSFCGSDLEADQRKSLHRYISRHTVSVDRDCIFLSSTLTIPSATVSFVPLKKSGDTLRAAPEDRSGIYFIAYQSLREMKEGTPRLRDHVLVEALEND